MFKRIMVVSALLGLFCTGLMAKESDYVEASTPELVLSKSDLSVLDKALTKGLTKLSKKEKKLIQKFLLDYSGAVKKEKIKDKNEVFPVPSKVKVKGKSSSGK